MRYDLVKEWNRKTVEKIAKAKGWKLNSDESIVNMIIEGLNKNLEKHNRPYCPCRVVTGDKENDKKIICPCVYSPKEIERDGICHCQLYVK